jgi:surface polysaccharide O-acyltransferase-like enzyme
VFVMISGGLVLSSARTLLASDFYRRRSVRLGIPLVVWTIAYLVFGNLVAGRPATVAEALRLVGFGLPYFHLYFLFVMAGLTIAAPLLRAAVEALDERKLLAAVAIAFGLAMVDNALVTLAGIGTPNAVTRWLPFVGDFLAGYALLSIPRTPGRVRIVAAIAVIGMAATAIGTAILSQPAVLGLGRGRYLYEYHSVTTVPVSLAVYLLLVWSGPWLARHVTGGAWRTVALLGAASFGIYLVHPMILVGLGDLGISATMTFAPVAILITVAITFVLSLLFVLVVRRIPGLRLIV